MYQHHSNAIFSEWYRRQNNVDPEYSFEPVFDNALHNPGWRCRLTCAEVDLVQAHFPNQLIHFSVRNFTAEGRRKKDARGAVAEMALNSYKDNEGRMFFRPGLKG